MVPRPLPTPWPLAAAAGAAALAAGAPGWAAAVGAAAVAGAWPVLHRARAARRAGRLAAQLPDTLVGLAAGLRAGRALPQVLADTAASAPVPLRDELTLVVRETGVGRPLDDALDAFAARVPGEDLRLAVVALGLGRGLGGDLADLLDRVAEAIRERQRLEARIRVLTSQGRAQGAILVLLPPSLALAVHAMDPTYLAPLLSTAPGRATLAVTALLQALGVAAIRRIVRVEP